MAQLYSRVLLNTVERMRMSNHENPVSTTSHIFPIPHPDPAHSIGITRVLGRLHLHNPRGARIGANEFTISLVRLSDQSLLGGAVFESTLGIYGGDFRLVSVDRETNHAPDFFKLAPGDDMVAVMEAFGDPQMFVTLGGFLAMSWVRLKPNGEPE